MLCVPNTSPCTYHWFSYIQSEMLVYIVCCLMVIFRHEAEVNRGCFAWRMLANAHVSCLVSFPNRCCQVDVFFFASGLFHAHASDLNAGGLILKCRADTAPS